MPSKYENMSRAELEKEDARLGKERTRIREEQVEVTGLLDAHRELERLNLPPETIKHMYRLASIKAASETETTAEEGDEQ